jgi:hypothetical protein
MKNSPLFTQIVNDLLAYLFGGWGWREGKGPFNSGLKGSTVETTKTKMVSLF